MQESPICRRLRLQVRWLLAGVQLLVFLLCWMAYNQAHSFLAGITKSQSAHLPFFQLRTTTYLGADGLTLQRSTYDCGDAALQMIFTHFRIPGTYQETQEQLRTPPSGATMLSLRNLALRKGLLCEGWRLRIEDLRNVPLPAIVFILGKHFAVLSAVRESGDLEILDPARGRFQIPMRKLQTIWTGETLLFHKPEGAPDRWYGATRQLTTHRKED